MDKGIEAVEGVVFSHTITSAKQQNMCNWYDNRVFTGYFCEHSSVGKGYLITAEKSILTECFISPNTKCRTYGREFLLFLNGQFHEYGAVFDNKIEVHESRIWGYGELIYKDDGNMT